MYDRTVKDRPVSFGVSGKLYESNVLLYDHQTESLWSQLQAAAVTGELTGTPLIPIASLTTTWQAWREQYPETLVLSTHTGFRRDYGRLPYRQYASSPRLMFPVRHADFRLGPKDKVLGVTIAGRHEAYSLAVLHKRAVPIQDQLGHKKITAVYDPIANSAQVVDAESGELLPSVVAYWFAWVSFHRETAVYGSPQARPRMPEGSH